MSNQITIEDFNRMAGLETRHPLVTVFRNIANKSSLHTPHSSLKSLTSDFYALIYKPLQSSLHLYRPGDNIDLAPDAYEGVLFHPDLLCGSHLERDIAKYPVRCRCKALRDYERSIIVECLADIDMELHHSIDRFTGMIIVSHIGLLLGYCVRFCDHKSKADATINKYISI